MTPEIRAARDRIAADADEAERVHSSLATTRISDLRLVLAALDRALPTRYDPKPHGHPWHACGSCSSDGMHPGKGCINCRHTGFDQTPCKTCAGDPDSRVVLKHHLVHPAADAPRGSFACSCGTTWYPGPALARKRKWQLCPNDPTVDRESMGRRGS